MKIGRGNQILGEKFSQYHFIHHKSHMTTGREPGRSGGKPETNRQITAGHFVVSGY
jgi:hypothetical protein